MTGPSPTFSIVVPVYNEEKYIREALNSILAQTDPDWEAILVDDGSTDATPGILDEYAKNDTRFRVFHKSNGGQSTAINKGVQEARGEWICWLSGDDYFHSKKLELNRRWIQDFSGIAFFFSGHWLIQPDGTKIEYDLDWLNLENSSYHLITLFRCNYVMGISICIKRDAWLRNRGFDENLRWAHDLDMWLRMMLNTPTRYIPDRTCIMRYHPGQETARFPLGPLFDVSKSVIRLINRYPFPTYFSGENLRDPQIAIDMLNRTLNFVASEPTANFYALGFHPALLLRILEWISNPEMDQALAKDLRSMLHQRASDIITHYHKIVPFALLWKAFRAALDFQQPSFVYHACEPSRVGELNYYYQKAAHNDNVAIPLRTYLEKYDGIQFIDDQSHLLPGRELVLLFPQEIPLDAPDQPAQLLLKEICQYFSQAGCSILMVGKSKYTFGLRDGFLFLGEENETGQQQLISGLGDIDTLISFYQPDWLNEVRAERILFYKLSNYNYTGIEVAIDLLNKIKLISQRSDNTSKNDSPIIHFLAQIDRKINFKSKRSK
jgi:glycosyltransferase involved in cell wall biosynthesis